MTFLPFCVTAGVWATKLGEMAGVKVPLIAMHHAYVVTERIEGIQVWPPFLESMLSTNVRNCLKRLYEPVDPFVPLDHLIK